MKKTTIEGALVYFGNSADMSDVADESVQLIVTTPPCGYVPSSHEPSPDAYGEYISSLCSVIAECVRVLSPDGKLCLHLRPYFEAEHTEDGSRRLTRTVLGDIERTVLSYPEMYEMSLFVLDCRASSHINSFGSYPYPTKIFSSFPYEWVAVFAKSGKRTRVPTGEEKENSRISKEEWSSWAVDSVWKIPTVSPKRERHPDPTHPEIARRLIRMYSFEGDTVLDPYLGSGTTALEALELGRKAIGFEIEESYLPVIENKLAFASIKQLSLFD